VPTTTIHFPEETLRRIDAVARQRRISRNRFVIQACEKAVASDAGEWPDGFFEQQISAADQALLTQAVKEMETAIARRRTSGGVPLL
jgi:predicted transcriptional regulator